MTKIPAREITPEALYLRRREFLSGAALTAASLTVGGALACSADAEPTPAPAADAQPLLEGVQPGPFGTDEPRTSHDDATSYNNFYEFGTDKSDPRRYAGSLRTKPWSVAIEGEVAKPGVGRTRGPCSKPHDARRNASIASVASKRGRW